MLVVADDDVSLIADSGGMPNTNTWAYSPLVVGYVTYLDKHFYDA